MWAAAVTPDGQHIISGANDMLVKVWSVASKTESTCEGHGYTVYAVAAMPDGRRILSGSGDQPSACGASAAPSKPFKLHTGAVYAVALPDNQHALRLARQHRQALQRQRRRRPAHLHGPPDAVRCLALLPDSRRFVSGLSTAARIVEHGLAPQVHCHTRSWYRELCSQPRLG